MIINNLNFLSFFRHNFFDKTIKRNKGKYLLPFGKTVISSKGSIELNGSLLLNSNKKTGNKKGGEQDAKGAQGDGQAPVRLYRRAV